MVVDWMDKRREFLRIKLWALDKTGEPRTIEKIYAEIQLLSENGYLPLAFAGLSLVEGVYGSPTLSSFSDNILRPSFLAA